MRLKELIAESFPDVGKTVSLGRRRRWARQIRASIENHPEAWQVVDLLRSDSPQNVAVSGTRRSAKTETAWRAIGAESIERDNYVALSMGRTLGRLARDAWERDGDRGFLGVLDALKVPYRTNRDGGQLHAILFPWGSVIRLHPIETVHQIEHLRGSRANVYWIDEAQGIGLLSLLLLEVLAQSTIDFGAHVLLSGTPGPECDGLFFGALNDPEWRSVRLATWLNPHLPGGSPEGRWRHVVNTAVRRFRKQYGVTEEQVDALLELSPDDLTSALHGHITPMMAPLLTRGGPLCLPGEVQREVLGLWVALQERYVHPVERWQDTLYWCQGANQHRVLVPDGLPVYQRWQDRVRMLPHGRVWEILVGYDLGYGHDPCAMWVGALDRSSGTVYELHSYKERLVGEDAQMAPLRAWLTEARALFATSGHRVRSWTVVIDANEGTGDAWNHKLTLHAGLKDVAVIPAKKPNKLLQISEVNLLMAEGRLKCVAGDPVDIEQRYLQWEPKPAEKERVRRPWKYRPVTLPDGTRCAEGTPQGALGDHALDARRYALITGYVLAGQEAEQPQNQTDATLARLMRR